MSLRGSEIQLYPGRLPFRQLQNKIDNNEGKACCELRESLKHGSKCSLFAVFDGAAGSSRVNQELKPLSSVIQENSWRKCLRKSTQLQFDVYRCNGTILKSHKCMSSQCCSVNQLTLSIHTPSINLCSCGAKK